MAALGCNRNNGQVEPLLVDKPSSVPRRDIIEPSSGNLAIETSPHEYLELIVHNANPNAAEDVSLVLMGGTCTFGIVGSGVSAGNLGWTRAVGTNVVVRWREEGGSKREARVDISRVYDPSSAGELKFVLKNEFATASFRRLERKK
ncbi:MAG TPA: hypothetical protein VMZ27_08005 [Candidatus Saccharimonadales bacterium]|nr:hypothetical protein [Candidatus Saccharimonadales bacterium]